MVKWFIACGWIVASCTPYIATANAQGFKASTKGVYDALRAVTDDQEDIRRILKKSFDIKYIAAKACGHKLSDAETEKLEDAVLKFGCFLLEGEAIKKVTAATMDTKDMSVTSKKTTTFVNSRLSDGTEFTVIFRNENRKIIDIRCVGISLAKVLDTVISKFCETQKINFKLKKLNERIDIIKKAIDWHIDGQQ
jgi:ABC-type transporter MlaC component